MSHLTQYPVVNIAGGPEGPPEPYFILEIVKIVHIRRYGTWLE